MKDPRYWIVHLGLERHPEGGYYRETYRCREGIAREHLPERFAEGTSSPAERSFSTAIFFLLAGDDFSAFHRIKQDEIWHFYDGAALVVHVIDPQGAYTALKLGRDADRGEALQAVVPAGCVFGAALADTRAYALAGCTVAPGFDFADLEIPARRELLSLFPQHRAIIERLTR